MGWRIRRLRPDDGAILGVLTTEDADFDLADRGGGKASPTPEAQRLYLADPSVLHWVAEDERLVLGHLHCQVIRKHAGDVELLLYEIGVRSAARRGGVGRALVNEMFTWMRMNAVTEVWVLADNAGAVEFYAACGFAQHEHEMAVYMTRELE